jgi:hypothetical protein
MPLTLHGKSGILADNPPNVIFSLDIFAAARYSLLDGTVTKTAVSEIDRSALDALELFQAALPAEFLSGNGWLPDSRRKKGSIPRRSW